MNLIICSCLVGGDEDEWRCPSSEPMMCLEAPEAAATAHFGLCMSQSSSVVVIKPAMCAKSANEIELFNVNDRGVAG